MKAKILSSRNLSSRIQSDTVQRSEQIFGYFLGPCLTYMMYHGVAGTYLTQFYTDVLGLAGGFLTMMPLLSKLVSSIASLFIGRMIDKTRTVQGKARPWILCSGILLCACGIALYAVPKASYSVRIAWIVISYNLFFSLAFSIYSLSHSLMVPLSTRDTKQRDSLAMLTSTGTAMIPGMLTTIVMPLLVKNIGVGSDARGAWLSVMGILSAVAIPATLMEYYFTRERVTEQVQSDRTEVSFGKQLAVCFKDRYWIIMMLFTLVIHLCNSISGSSMLYFCNWVLGDSIASGATKQILVNMIGQFPLGIGIVILWPLVRRFGKRTVTIVGFSVAAVGSGLVLLAGNNIIGVLGGLLIKSTGALPTYVMAALLAEALDHVEASGGFRADGFSASLNSIIQTVVVGLGQTVLLAGIHSFGYVAPESAVQIISQPEQFQMFLRICFAGVPLLGYIACVIFMLQY